MRINVKAKPNSNENKVEKIDDLNFVVSVKDPPVQGRANRAIVKLLSEYFHTLNIRIVSGHISRQKIVEIK
ncbi:MAG: hypothetical protein A3I26_03535 [Candidatus Yanofskybacteria bacterium RIFCSPLOWO2_02_FULL_43_10]|uniref:Uncharacterized protein n=1 Tax=Candidatus Yanofskybacteria bacterium RIFCSPLOWO2_12_FULL_43_11b TaxID=1802710 RepID=A0A1F8HB09_9BACT|nr:MAG: hypothetical protein A2742_00715 [Candidatus Yanofskybacteria bacterium RIFCSPHIGHO2_01_FULL_43_32]OGN11285.1 MAG: hypothetical protein A3C69_00850 [Candidatus Yanofskybacteria bacterium RIFCSPHIGHO2_02_FULL_43_12]OGN17599.1 MAG: hypothetical protein A3E34_01440 [Candidatus Yanofskybacteria bacterium RIFCSPHIGHO2_12_FULL_43_11]OGN24207.1 MAG: hypothetical protein A2923_02655 [Candidatus Yanofskybacteria bacterium RIFCSPLOWO2_01_FULL_43_46]OGN30669.1 MAG: hypothetical protein A3I26_03535